MFVGGGYAGVEGLAELQDFAAAAIDRYPRCRTQGMRWILVEAMDRVLPPFPPDRSASAQRWPDSWEWPTGGRAGPTSASGWSASTTAEFVIVPGVSGATICTSNVTRSNASTG